MLLLVRLVNLPNKNDAGAVYIFKNNGGSWNQTDKLTASDAAANDKFGSAVDIHGDYISKVLRDFRPHNVSINVGFQNSIEASIFHLPVVAFHTNQKLWILAAQA